MSSTATSREPAASAAETARILEVLGTVCDPELPVLSVVDLGIVRSLETEPDGTLNVGLSPTYSGCPATAAIRADVAAALAGAGYMKVRIVEVLAPPWTTDWLSIDGRRKLLAYGIAPPAEPAMSLRSLAAPNSAAICPGCASLDTELLSEFGSTPCKALHRCNACLEPFDRFKCI